MPEEELFLIWAGNHEFELIADARVFFRTRFPDAKVHIRNADVYGGKSDVEQCDGVFVQPDYERIIEDFKQAKIKVYGLEEIEPQTSEPDEIPAGDNINRLIHAALGVEITSKQEVENDSLKAYKGELPPESEPEVKIEAKPAPKPRKRGRPRKKSTKKSKNKKPTEEVTVTCDDS